MKTVLTTGVQPSVLRWARQTIGLSTDDVARRIKRPVGEVDGWESGFSSPTYSQLEKLAYEVYKRPIALFFMPTAPEEDTPQHEFRSLPDSDLQSLMPDTRLRIRHAHAFQVALRQLFEERNPSRIQIWNHIRLTVDEPIVEQCAAVRELLGVTLGEQASWNDADRALTEWRTAVEASGVFVFKWAFKQKDISGLSLLDPEFPLIYINNSTAKTRQTFSLFHELAHLLLNTNGLCEDDGRLVEGLPVAIRGVEQFCNRFAAEILVPVSDFVEQTKNLPPSVERSDDEVFADIASRYSVSLEVILRRFLDQGRMSRQAYDTRVQGWAKQKGEGSGGNYYATTNAYLSQRFAQEVIRQHSKNRLTVEQAAELLGVKAKSYLTLEQHILRSKLA